MPDCFLISAPGSDDRLGRSKTPLTPLTYQPHQTATSPLFGAAIIPVLRPKLAGLSAADRELVVIEAISRALVEMGGKFVLPFRFRDARGSRTSHYLIFVSKHVLGYTIMKGIMANESSLHIQGVPSFEYSPATKAQPFLFELTRPLDDLAPMLLACFAGRTMTTKEIFDEHHVGRPYILSNYKAVLSALEEEHKVTCEPVAIIPIGR